MKSKIENEHRTLGTTKQAREQSTRWSQRGERHFPQSRRGEERLYEARGGANLSVKQGSRAMSSAEQEKHSNFLSRAKRQKCPQQSRKADIRPKWSQA